MDQLTDAMDQLTDPNDQLNDGGTDGTTGGAQRANLHLPTGRPTTYR